MLPGPGNKPDQTRGMGGARVSFASTYLVVLNRKVLTLRPELAVALRPWSGPPFLYLYWSCTRHKGYGCARAQAMVAWCAVLVAVLWLGVRVLVLLLWRCCCRRRSG